MMRHRSAVAAILAFLATLLAACDLGTEPTTTTTLAPTALQVGVEIHRSLDYDGTLGVVWYFDIEHNGTDIDDSALVSVNATIVAPTLGFTGWTYMLDETEGAVYSPGQDYEISVTYGGSTYSETLQVPGEITISPDYRQVSWSYGGGHSTISVNHTYGSDTYKYPGSLGALTSPWSIPASAYPSSGQYDLTVNIGTLVNGFGGLRGSDSYIWMYDFVRKRFTL